MGFLMVSGEEEFDPDAIQARIDLSLSITQDLVSSWLHPSYKLHESSRNAEKELGVYQAVVIASWEWMALGRIQWR